MACKKTVLSKELKAIIFDLDDTLYDCFDQLVKPARRFALHQMIDAGLDVPFDCLLKKRNKYSKDYKEERIYRELVKSFNLQNKKLEKAIVNAGYLSFYNYFRIKNPKIKLFPDAKNILSRLKKKYKLFLLTLGIKKTQEKKIHSLGIKDNFDRIYFKSVYHGADKKTVMKKILKDHNLKPNQVMMIGDRRDSDISSANSLGIYSALRNHGEYNHLKPKNKLEEADFEFKRLSQLKIIFDI
ncbi:MAG: HAD family hydrolase [Candidatus Nanoarchaeia archaeon]|nr:HAD family hydrolase [Candidatus Nanoarchaeia archaeon]